jgi:glycerol-3-phosphate dehydrogenase
LFGTTDVDEKNEAPNEPRISKAELDYLMAAVTYAFPILELNEGDIQATLSGIRSVVDTGKKNPSQESREHVIWSEDGLLTVTGGKLTTFRMMALDALRTLGIRPTRNQRIRHRPVLDLVELLLNSSGLEPRVRQRLSGRYGRDAGNLILAAAPGELMPVNESLGHRALWAELRWAARAEGIVHLDDLLLRRVRLGLLLPQGAMPWLAQIHHIVQPELGWDDQRWENEVRAYAQQWRQNYSLPSPAKRHLAEVA